MNVSRWWGVACAGVLTLFAVVPSAALPTQVSYQGHLEKNGTPYDGTADFKFAIVNGGSTVWSNDGTGTGGSEPSASVAVLVDQGLFSVLLGASPMAPLSAAELAQADAPMLRVWVDTGGGFEQLADQPLASSAYALQSDGASHAYGDFTVDGEVQVATGIRFPDNSLQTTAGSGGPDADWVINGNDMHSGVSGFVGVGTATPARTFQVAGQARSNDWELGTGNATSVGHLYMDNGGNLDLAGPGGVGIDPGLVLRGGLPNGGGQVLAYNGAGNATVDLEGDSGGGSQLQMGDEGGATITLDGKDGAGGGIATFTNNNHGMTVRLRGQAYGGGSQLELFGSDGSLAHQWTAENREWKVYSPTGALKIWMIADDGSGKSRIRTDVVEITGGADLSERFDLASECGPVAPGTVVSIDPANPGQLMCSASAYDATVAGVVSGAGGVDAGLVMGHQGTRADGAVAVALTGRVWTRCDATGGPIHPGDLLTTSGRPGCAMRVADPDRARGAILGKAMTALEHGTGLVLVLVSLQ